jgi:phage tail tape-measure protein
MTGLDLPLGYMDYAFLTAMLTGLLTGTFVLLAGTFLIIAIRRLVKQQKRALLELLSQYFESPDETTPSEFAKTVESIAQVFASKVINSAKTTAMGMNSVASKNESKVDAAIIQDVAGSVNPLLGLVAGLPTVQKLMNKNPNVWPIVQGKLGELLGSKSGNSGSSPAGGDTSDFNKI